MIARTQSSGGQFEPPYPIILEGLEEGRVIPFLGAGASLSSRPLPPGTPWKPAYLPTGNELACYLAEKTNFPSDEPPGDLAKVTQYYDVVNGRGTLNKDLHGIFNSDFPFASLHNFLAEMSVSAPLLIITTNYDDLIERAFDAKGLPYDVVIHRVGGQLYWRPHGSAEPHKISPTKLDIELDKVTVIYKMHGAVDRQEPDRDQYVITEDDYIDFLARMTTGKAIPRIFAEPFSTRHFLFLGYGLYDWNLRVVLNRIEKDLRGRKDIGSWAIQYKPKPLEQRLWQERDVEVYDITIEEFMSNLIRERVGGAIVSNESNRVHAAGAELALPPSLLPGAQKSEPEHQPRL